MVSSDADCANVVDCPDESKPSSEGIHSTETDNAECADDFNASDVTSSFDRMKVIYKKIGDNESQAFGVWKQLSDNQQGRNRDGVCEIWNIHKTGYIKLDSLLLKLKLHT